jgi:hypothetical protein
MKGKDKGKFMKFFAFSAVLLLLLSSPAWACAEPSFPVPGEVRLVQLKQKDGEALTSSDEFLLGSYQKDKQRYLDVYDQLYPCSLYGDKVIPANMPEDQAEVLKQELTLLERKWGEQGATEKNRAADEEFTDVPDEDFTAVE